MTTTVDPSLVLTELPTRPGSVIGHAGIERGAMVFEVMVLTTVFNKQDVPVDLAWFDNLGEEIKLEDATWRLRTEDWTLIGVVPLGDNDRNPQQQALLDARHAERMGKSRVVSNPNDIPW